ncbi:MAG: ParB/RepB/Spo0J family partition protein [Bacteroidales bacterium]|nr:ParB/RepB/Spo0J family partition protein [Bacteroidales bacterium]
MDKKSNTKPSLGKGLTAIFSDNEYSVISANSSARIKSDANTHIRVDAIEVNPGQPRVDFNEAALEELAQSIRTYGLIQPITVRPIENGRYQLISGERRWRASKMAGLVEIPAFVRSVDEVLSIQMALVENIQRADLNAIEIAISYKRLLEECDLTQEQLCEKVGKNKTTVVNYLRLLKLSKEVQIAVRDNQISMGHARCIVGFEDFDIQNQMLQKIVSEGLSVRETESLAKRIAGEIKPKKKVRIKLSDELLRFRSELAKKVNAPVSISRDLSGKGKISISFKSDAELKALMDILGQ